MERAIVHIDIPGYFAAIEERRDRSLRKKAFALSLLSSRAIIQGVSANARKEGIREGMLLFEAKKRSPNLLILPPDLSTYREHHERLLDLLGSYSPLVEGMYLGDFFLDLTGTRRLLGVPCDVAFGIEKRLAREEGLPVRAGLSGSKLVSQVAAHVGSPGDLRYIFKGLESPFLNPLPVTALPGVGEKTARVLSNLNIESIGELAKLASLYPIFGRGGERLLRIARGIDPSPVLPLKRTQSLSFKQELGEDSNSRERIEAAFLKMSEEAGWKLRKLNRSPSRFHLEVRYADGMTGKIELSIPPSLIRFDRSLFRTVLCAYERIPCRRVAVRSLSLEFSQFAMPLRQMLLFDWEEEPRERDLQGGLDSIRGRFGRSAILWGRSLL